LSSAHQKTGVLQTKLTKMLLGQGYQAVFVIGTVDRHEASKSTILDIILAPSQMNGHVGSRLCREGEVCFGQSGDIGEAAKNVTGQADSPHSLPKGNRCPFSRNVIPSYDG
jgi:hypothetical protein